MADELIRVEGNELAIAVDNRTADLLKPLDQEILLYETYLSGLGRVDDPEALDALKAQDPLILLREDDFLDEYAIAVHDISGRKLGYISEKDNLVFARLMDAGKRITAKVKSIDSGEPYKKVRISLFLVDF